MTDNLKQIIEEFEQLKGQFVITGSWTIERLVAIGDDETDYYWITYNGRKLSWHTCVGGVMKLKDQLKTKDYNELVRLARLNHFDQVTLWGNSKDDPKYIEATEAHKREMETLPENHVFLTQICWDLN